MAEIVIPENIAIEVANILRQDADPSHDLLADILDPPSAPVVPTVIETVTKIVGDAQKANDIVNYIVDRIITMGAVQNDGPNLPSSITNAVADLIKNT